MGPREIAVEGAPSQRASDCEAVVTRSETTLGKALRAARMGRGFGLRELARRVGISATYLSRIETGEERRPPSEEALTALARDLAADPDELLALAGRVPADVLDILLADRTLWATLRQVANVGMTGDLMRAQLGLPEDES